MFILAKNKKALFKSLILYICITVFIAIFGFVYEQFSHNVHTLYMYLAWLWVLGFGVIPYLLLYLLPIKIMPGFITECIYNLGVAFLTARSIYCGVIIIYGTTGEQMIMVYSILASICLIAGSLLFVFGLLMEKEEKE